ncbi:hypothetical protein D3C81_1948920 [compost metagenome]
MKPSVLYLVAIVAASYESVNLCLKSAIGTGIGHEQCRMNVESTGCALAGMTH